MPEHRAVCRIRRTTTISVRRIASALGIAAALSAGLTAPALADPTSSVQLSAGTPVRDCVPLLGIGQRCGLLGKRAVRVDWMVSCPTGEAPELTVHLRRASAAGAASTDPVVEDVAPAQAAGNAEVEVEPGQRLYAESIATCPAEGRATVAMSAVLALPPVFVDYAAMENRICGFPKASLRRTLQANNWAYVLYFVRFAAATTEQVGSSPDFSAVTLHANGAGLSIRRAPDRLVARRYRQPGLRLLPKRGGEVKLWATVDGMKTIKRTVKVLPARRACRPR